MSRFTYSPAMISFIAKAYQKMGIPEVTQAFNAQFVTSLTEGQIRGAIKNNRITCGRKTGSILKGVLRSYTAEQAKFIKKQYQKLSIDELTIAFNSKFGTEKTVKQIRAFTRNHSIKSGRTGRFEKGAESWNAGKKGWTAGGRSAETRFKKGHQSNDLKPVGSTRICSKDGYVVVKVALPNKWRLMHIVEWEKHHGPVPKGHRLWFKDNDRTNWHIDNLMLITRAQGAVINKQGFGTVPAELKTAAVTLADISMKRRALTNPGAAA